MPLITRTERTAVDVTAGVDDPRVAYSVSDQHFGLSPLTVLAYLQPAPGPTTAGMIFDKGISSTSNGVRFFRRTTGQIGFYVNSAMGRASPGAFSARSLQHDIWQHVAVTWSGSHLAAGINFYAAEDGEQITHAGAENENNGSTAQLYPFSENDEPRRGLRVYNSSVTSNNWPLRADVAYIAAWKADLSLAELEQARQYGPLSVRTEDLVLLRANGADLSGYDAVTFIEPTFPNGALPPNLNLGGESELVIQPLEFGIEPRHITLPGDFSPPLVVSPIKLGATLDTVALLAGPSAGIVIHDDFERSSINAAMSSVEMHSDGTEIVVLEQRLQTVSGMGTDRWLEPVARVSGLLGKRVRFKIVPYGISPADGRNHQTWYSAMRGHFSYDGINWEKISGYSISPDLIWRHGTPFTQDTVYVARSWPRSVTRVGQQIEALAAAHPALIQPAPSASAFTPTATTGFPAQAYVAAEIDPKTDELGRSVPATPLYALAIDDRNYGPKPLTAVITAGIHSGEDLGELAMWEFLDFLCGDSAEAISLRQTTRVLVYPLVNPAGRYAGYWRGEPGTTIDPNREWRTAMPAVDCVAKAKPVILNDAEGAIPVAWAFDFHASPGGGGALQLGIYSNQPPTLEFDRLVRERYPTGKWAYYGATSPPVATSPTLSDTLRGFHGRELQNILGILCESCDRYGPLSPEVMRPYAEAMVGALAQMQTDKWFGEIAEPATATRIQPAAARIAVAGYVATVTRGAAPVGPTDPIILRPPYPGRVLIAGYVPVITAGIYVEPPLVYPPGVYPPLGQMIQSREKWADEAKFERTTNGQLRARSLWTQRRLESLQLQHVLTRRELEALFVFYDENRMQVIDVVWNGDGQAYPMVFRTPPQVECLGGDAWRVTSHLEGS